MNKFRIIVSSVLIAVLCGCISASMEYQPKAMDRERALRVVEKVLKEQPGEYGPVNLVLEDDRFEIKRNRRVPVTIYYSSVERVAMYTKGKSFRMGIIDKSGINRIWIVSYSEEQAKLFVDAIHTLSSSAEKL